MNIEALDDMQETAFGFRDRWRALEIAGRGMGFLQREEGAKDDDAPGINVYLECPDCGHGETREG